MGRTSFLNASTMKLCGPLVKLSKFRWIAHCRWQDLARPQRLARLWKIKLVAVWALAAWVSLLRRALVIPEELRRQRRLLRQYQPPRFLQQPPPQCLVLWELGSRVWADPMAHDLNVNAPLREQFGIREVRPVPHRALVRRTTQPRHWGQQDLASLVQFLL